MTSPYINVVCPMMRLKSPRVSNVSLGADAKSPALDTRMNYSSALALQPAECCCVALSRHYNIGRVYIILCEECGGLEWSKQDLH